MLLKELSSQCLITGLVPRIWVAKDSHHPLFKLKNLNLNLQSFLGIAKLARLYGSPVVNQ